MIQLDKPFLFVFNFGSILPAPDLDRLANAAGAQYACYECVFTHENLHADQVRYTLEEAFRQIMEYAETGVTPEGLR